MVSLRRVIFSVVDITLVILPSFKYMIFAFLHLISLLVHVLIQPYCTSFFNRVELGSLLALTMLSVILATFPDPKSIQSHPSIQAMITLIVVIPIVAFGMYAMRRTQKIIRLVYQQCRASSRNNSRDSSIKSDLLPPSEHDDDDAYDDDNDNGNGADDLAAYHPSRRQSEIMTAYLVTSSSYIPPSASSLLVSSSSAIALAGMGSGHRASISINNGNGPAAPHTPTRPSSRAVP